ncbi:MAG: ParB N-terminal domain-containing protein [Planctomycetota bacterium]|jgi:ParB family chromosome partitioning protein
MMKKTLIRKMEDRLYTNIPIDKIKVLNSRNRDRSRFEENIRSIRDVGLLKPIVVNERHFEKNGFYELVCGEGRFLAYKELKQTEIPAEVINCSRRQAYLYSLVENIARVSPGTMWFAREVKRMRDGGISITEICRITGKGDNYIRDYIRLVEQGEERLIKGIEDGIFPISFAKKVAQSDDASIQNILMDAFDNGIVNSRNFPTVKKIIANRAKGDTQRKRSANNSPVNHVDQYSIQHLRRDILKMTKEKEAFVNETETKENRLLTLLDGLKNIWEDAQAVDIIQSENVGPLPELKGTYHVI